MRWTKILLFLLLILLPTQLGKHFWSDNSIISGRRIDYLSPTLHSTDLIIFLIAGLLISSKVKKTPIRLFVTGVICALGVAVFWISSNTLWYPWFSVFVLGVFGWVLSRIRFTSVQLLLTLGIGAGGQTLLALAQFLSQRSVGGLFYFLGERSFSSLTPGIAQLALNTGLYLRPYGTLPHPNVLGGYLTIVFSLFLFLPNKFRKSKALVLLRNTILTLSVTGIAISFSRMAWFGMILLIIVYLFWEKRHIRTKTIFLLLIFVLIFIEELTVGRLASGLSLDSEAIIDRKAQYVGATQLFLDQPLFGIGLGGYLRSAHRLATPPFLFQPIHSVYLMITVEAGIFGLLLFATASWYALKNSWEKKRRWWFMSLVIILFLGTFDHYMVTIHQTQLLFVLVWMGAAGWVHT